MKVVISGGSTSFGNPNSISLDEYAEGRKVFINDEFVGDNQNRLILQLLLNVERLEFDKFEASYD